MQKEIVAKFYVLFLVRTKLMLMDYLLVLVLDKE